jgi:hypothetical protein
VRYIFCKYSEAAEGMRDRQAIKMEIKWGIKLLEIQGESAK